MFRTQAVEKTNSNFKFSNNPPPHPKKTWKFYRLWGNVEKYCRRRQATDGTITRRTRIACWVLRTPSEYVMLIAFRRQ